MNVSIISDFRDKADWAILYKKGDVLDVCEERAGELVSLGLAELMPVTPDTSSETAVRNTEEAEASAVKKGRRRKV